MFVTNSLYDPVVQDIARDDVKFWQSSLEIAQTNMLKVDDKDVDIKAFKMNTPAYFCSQMYADDNIAFTRKEYNRRLKDQRRKSIVLDLDCDSKEEFELYRDKMIEFAIENKYYVCIYPTISFPEKPHFRAVYFCNRGLNAIKYAKAVSWLYEKLNIVVTDFSDFDIRASRNLPVFVNVEQTNAIYSNLKDNNFNKIDSKTWNDYELEEELEEKINKRLKRSQKAPEKLKQSNYFYNREELLKAWSEFIKSKKGEYQSYDNVWKVLSSIAKAYVSGEISWDTAEKLALELSKVNEDKQTQWYKGNIELIRKFCNQDSLNEAKDLLQYSTSILTSVRVNENNKKDKEDS